MSELEVLRRVEGLARDVKMNSFSVLAERVTKCGHCGEAPALRGLQNEIRSALMKDLRNLEAAFVELDLLRAGTRSTS
jgi:hypothetical protein